VQDFHRLAVWQKAHDLTLRLYTTTMSFPRDETFGLVSQLRRAAASVPANIAEGCGRGSRAELARFLGIAAGSASELEYHLLLARDLKYLTESEYESADAETREIKRMLYGLIRRIRLERLPDNPADTDY
jgi:four helix bundle protein